MRLLSLLLYVRDLDESLRFYEHTLQMPVVRRPARHLAVLEPGETLLYLHEDQDDAPDWLGGATPAAASMGQSGTAE